MTGRGRQLSLVITVHLNDSTIEGWLGRWGINLWVSAWGSEEGGWGSRRGGEFKGDGEGDGESMVEDAWLGMDVAQTVPSHCG